MRFHMVGLAYVPTSKRYPYCAFTHRMIRLCRMLKTLLGHEVYFYGVEGSEVECTEFVPILSADEYQRYYGHLDPDHNILPVDQQSDAYRVFMERAVAEQQKRMQPRDIILAMVGYYHKPCSEPFMGTNPVVEPGIGYGGTFAPYRVFETYNWMHYMYGMMGIQDGQWFDAVIPPAFDPDEFPFVEQKKPYVFYMSRIVYRKGIMIALELAKRLSFDLIVAGQGSLKNEAEMLDINPADYPTVTFLNRAVGIEERGKLMSEASAFMAPTIYIEPNGNVAIEAAFCGTPVITTDWGGFAENVLHGLTGYRCRTWDDFQWALRNTGRIKPKVCREWAEQNYSEAVVAPKYEEYFQKVLQSFYEPDGWYYNNINRPPLAWLEKHYPCTLHVEHPEQPVEIELVGRFMGVFFPASVKCGTT